MKFGKQLQRLTANDRWRLVYLNYKALKQAIKACLDARASAASAASAASGDDEGKLQGAAGGRDATRVVGTAPFFFLLSRELRKIDAHYLREVEALRKRFVPLVFRLNSPALASKTALAEFVELYDDLNHMRGFVALNSLACAKILKKFDKKVNGNAKELNVKESFMREYLRHRPFIASRELADLLTQAECVSDTLAVTKKKHAGCDGACCSGKGGAAPGEDAKMCEEHYLCPICIDLLSNPVVLSCAHRFCWSCLKDAAQFGESCPVCRKEQCLDPADFLVNENLQDFLRVHFPDQAAERARREKKRRSVKARFARALSVVDEDGETGAAAKGSGGGSGQGSGSAKTAAAAAAPDTAVGGVIAYEQGIPVINRFRMLEAHSGPKTLIVVDLDETVIRTPSGSSLLSQAGIDAYTAFVGSAFAGQRAERNRRYRWLQQRLDLKVLCEDDTADVIREMQANGSWVLGLTARYSQLAAQTSATLSRLRVDLNKHSPLPRDQALQDPDTSALFYNGVIFTNATDKAVVLHRFLDNVVFRTDGHSGIVDDGSPAAGAKKATGKRAARVPDKIVFVDDRLPNCLSIARNLTFADSRGIRVVSYRYVGGGGGGEKGEGGGKEGGEDDIGLEEVIDAQIRAFVGSEGRVLLSDSDVRREIRLQRR